MADPTLRLFTFSPAHGLPTAGPFGLKLEMALRMADIDYERVHEDDNRKGPKRKSPWIEQGDVRMGDTDLILAHLGVDHEQHLDPRDRAQGLVLRRMLEEHWHQILEYELFVHPDGYAALDEMIAKLVPAPIVKPFGWFIRRQFRNHLFERGIARHTLEEVERMGRADLDALAGWLEGRTFAVGDTPSLTDCSAFGLLAPAIWSSTPTPCFRYARQLPALVGYCEGIRARFFPEVEPPAALQQAG